MPINDAEQQSTAYHEASHGVIATLLGAAVRSISIRCEHGTWVGDTPITWSEGAGATRKEKIFQVAVAGPLGQAKYRACHNWNGATFGKNDRLPVVIRIIREGELEEDPT